MLLLNFLLLISLAMLDHHVLLVPIFSLKTDLPSRKMGALSLIAHHGTLFRARNEAVFAEMLQWKGPMQAPGKPVWWTYRWLLMQNTFLGCHFKSYWDRTKVVQSHISEGTWTNYSTSRQIFLKLIDMADYWASHSSQGRITYLEQASLLFFLKEVGSAYQQWFWSSTDDKPLVPQSAGLFSEHNQTWQSVVGFQCGQIFLLISAEGFWICELPSACWTWWPQAAFHLAFHLRHLKKLNTNTHKTVGGGSVVYDFLSGI